MKSIYFLLLFFTQIELFANSIFKPGLNSKIITTETTVYIPVVVHIIESGSFTVSNQEVLTRINMLNSVFNGSASFLTLNTNIGIQFRMAKLHPQCGSTSGIIKHDYTSEQSYNNSGVK